MRITTDEIQSRVAALVDQNESTSAIASTDYSLRLKFINMALLEWAEIYDWQTLYGEYNMLVSTSTGNASIVLPNNFRKLASYPKITYDGANTAEFGETRGQEAGKFIDSDKRVEVLGNPQDGYILRVFGPTLSSGASVKVPYYKSVSSLASPANIAEIPNPDFLVKRTIAYWWEAREDPRFVQAKSDAQRILQNMIEYENVFGEAAYHNRVQTTDEAKYGFRWGKD